jgi:chitodextrinase
MSLLLTNFQGRGSSIASTTWSPPAPKNIVVPSGLTNSRLLIGIAAGRFYIDNHVSITFNGVAGTLKGETSSGPAPRVHVWEWINPSAGTFPFVVTNTTNTNDGTWFWALFDEVSGSTTVFTDESANDNNANPAATVPPSALTFMVAFGLVASTGGTTPFATDGTADGVVGAAGVVPNRTYPSNTQMAAFTVVVPQGSSTVITGPSGAAGATSITHSVNENQNSAGTWSAVGGTTWSLTGTDASLLSIDSSGVVTLASGNFNREVKSTYSFNVLRDAISQAVSLTILNVNEAPVFSGTISVPNLTVSTAMTPVSFASMFTDVDIGDSLTYSQVGTWPAGVSISGTSITGTPTVVGTSTSLRVRATDGGGLTVDSNIFTINVVSTADTTPPSLSGSVSSSSVLATSATISWPAGSDNVAVTGYEYSLNGGAYTSVGNVTSIGLTGLTPSTSYTVNVRAFDGAGNRSSAITGGFTTGATSDTTPPTLTGSITIGTVSSSSIQISWPAGSDNVAVVGYDVSFNGGSSYSSLGNVLTFTFTGLTASTSYSLRVRARDAAGNVSSALSVTQSTSAPSSLTKRIVVVLTTNGTTPAASLLNLKWAFFDQNTPDQFTAPCVQGATELTDSSGVLEIDVSSSSLAIGQTGWLIITDSDGTVFQNPPAKAFSAPVQVIAAV